MKRVEIGSILANTEISPGIFSMTIHLPLIAADCVPGQFVMLYLDRGDTLLPRPISICDADCEEGSLTLVYQVVGSGTAHLSGLKPGASLRILGPLGNGFAQKNGLRSAALVGGGIGAPPLLMLAKQLRGRGVALDACLGFRDTSILTDEFTALGAQVHIATDSGREGLRGTVIDLLRAHNLHPDEIFACGPKPMLSALAGYARQHNIPCQVCLEERMACGLGACVGCVVKSQGKPEYKKVCCDGPVFYTDEVVLDG